MARSTSSVRAIRSRRLRAVQRLSMRAGEVCCRDLSMRTRISFSREIGWTTLSGVRVTSRLNQETPLEVVPTFLGAHAIPLEDRESPGRYVDLVINEMLPRVAK